MPDLHSVEIAPAVTYRLEISPRAVRDIDFAVVRFSELEGEKIAAEWQLGLVSFFETLSIHPRRFPLAREHRAFASEIRQAIYSRSSNSVRYRLFYRVSDSTLPFPIVLLIHVRHSAARDITRKQAREIEAQDEQ